MKIKVMTLNKSFMETEVMTHANEIKIDGIKQIILSLVNDELFKKIANDMCGQVLQDFERSYQEKNGRMSVFASFFNERSIVTGKPFYKLFMESEVNGDNIDCYVEVRDGNEALYFLIADSFAHIPESISADTKMLDEINVAISTILKGFVDGTSEHAVKLLMKKELTEKEDDILISLAFGVYGPALSEKIDVLLPQMKEYIEKNKDANNKK